MPAYRFFQTIRLSVPGICRTGSGALQEVPGEGLPWRRCKGTACGAGPVSARNQGCVLPRSASARKPKRLPSSGRSFFTRKVRCPPAWRTLGSFHSAEAAESSGSEVQRFRGVIGAGDDVVAVDPRRGGTRTARHITRHDVGVGIQPRYHNVFLGECPGKLPYRKPSAWRFQSRSSRPSKVPRVSRPFQSRSVRRRGADSQTRRKACRNTHSIFPPSGRSRPMWIGHRRTRRLPHKKRENSRSLMYRTWVDFETGKTTSFSSTMPSARKSGTKPARSSLVK